MPIAGWSLAPALAAGNAFTETKNVFISTAGTSS
jgi:hypothetical protein